MFFMLSNCSVYLIFTVDTHKGFVNIGCVSEVWERTRSKGNELRIMKKLIFVQAVCIVRLASIIHVFFYAIFTCFP